MSQYRHYPFKQDVYIPVNVFLWGCLLKNVQHVNLLLHISQATFDSKLYQVISPVHYLLHSLMYPFGISYRFFYLMFLMTNSIRGTNYLIPLLIHHLIHLTLEIRLYHYFKLSTYDWVI